VNRDFVPDRQAAQGTKHDSPGIGEVYERARITPVVRGVHRPHAVEVRVGSDLDAVAGRARSQDAVEREDLVAGCDRLGRDQPTMSVLVLFDSNGIRNRGRSAGIGGHSQLLASRDLEYPATNTMRGEESAQEIGNRQVFVDRRLRAAELGMSRGGWRRVQ
jgi:hypothetical protein